ncbi:MAG: beta-lactamase family protein [Bryobacterales bacterium]|nr:beta-lactamase family protein [Bryobacterales bacterium]
MLRRTFLLVLSALPVCAQLPVETVERIGRLVETKMAKDSIPGLSVAVAVNGELRWEQGYGFQDLEALVPATSQTVYRLASISKPITAVAAMQLSEQGRLDLHSPVQRYVPSFPAKPLGTVTVGLLLAHLGGIRHYNGNGELDTVLHYDNVADAIGVFANDPLVAEPGTKYSYSTYGYNLAGAAVQAASGERFHDYVQRHICQPAGLTTLRDDNRWEIVRHRTRFYSKRQDGTVFNAGLTDTSNKIPGGGMVATAGDIVRFALAVRGGVLLKPETVRTMWAPRTLRNGGTSSYGYGWDLGERNGRRVVGHSGGQQGTSTRLFMEPDTGTAVVVMANLDQAGVDGLADAILDAVQP